MRAPRDICPECGRSCALNRDGTIRAHGWHNLYGDWCLGSWRPPQDEALDDEIVEALHEEQLTDGEWAEALPEHSAKA